MALSIDCFCTVGFRATSQVLAETRIIPSVTLTERLDSNVLFAPVVVPGVKAWDYVSSLSPTLQVLDKTRDVETTLDVGGTGSVFLNNTDLNFMSGYFSGSVILDGWVGRMIPGLKLKLANSFSYTPESPSFVQAGTIAANENVFARGIQTVRADRLSNASSVTVSYALTDTLTLHGDYQFSLLRFGNILAEQPTTALGLFFDSDFQRWTLGTRYRFAGGDSAGITFSNVTQRFRDSGENLSTPLSGAITARGFEADYLTITRLFTLEGSAGATLLEQSNKGFFSGKLVLSTALERTVRLSVNVSRQLAPSFFGVGGTLVSTSAGASLTIEFSRVLSLQGSGNYAINKTAPEAVAEFESYSANATLSYLGWRDITPTFSFDYTRFDFGTQGTGFVVNRNAFILGLTARWP